MADQRANIFISAFDRSKSAFDSVSRNIDGLQSKVGGIVGGLGKLTAVGAGMSLAFSALGNIKAISILDQLDELSEKSGLSVEALSGLRYASEVAGTPLEALTGGLSRLSRMMASAAAGSKEAAAAFDQLGVKVKNADGTLRGSDQVLEDLADKFASYEDGAGKASYAQELFGKSGGDMIPILNQGSEGIRKLRGEAEQLGAVYDTKTAKAAAQFNDNLERIKLSSEAAAVSVAGPLIESLARLSEQFIETRKTGGFFDAWLSTYKKVHNDFYSGVLPDALLYDLPKPLELMGPPAPAAGPAPEKPPMPGFAGGGKSGSKAPVDDPTKKLLDNQLKMWERTIAQEGSALSRRNKMLDLYLGQGMVSLESYYDDQQAALNQATTAQVKAYDEQIAALNAYMAAKGRKESERAETEGKIAALVEKQADLQRDADMRVTEMAFQRADAMRGLDRTVRDVNAQFLEMTGRLGEAAGIKFDLQFQDTYRLLSNNVNPEVERMLSALRQSSVVQAQLNNLTQKFSLVQGDLQMGEERITMARERGTLGEIEALQRSGQLRRQAYARMQQEVEKYAKEEALIGLTDEQLQSYQRLQLQMEQLQGSLDPLANRFDAIFQDGAGTLLDDLTSRTKSAGQAFEDFGDSIYKQVNSLISKQLGNELMKSLFGDTSQGGGVGSLLSGLLGGGKGGGGGAGTGLIGNIGNWFAGFFAEGGTIPAGQWGIAGEKGAELIEGPATVTPMHKLGGQSFSQTLNINLSGAVDRRTIGQIASQSGVAAQRALARGTAA